jgi:hypothetical protein
VKADSPQPKAHCYRRQMIWHSARRPLFPQHHRIGSSLWTGRANIWTSRNAQTDIDLRVG